MEEIYSIYDGTWAPDQIVVDKGDEEIDGEYNFLDRGGGGVIYLNKEKDKVMKISHSLNEIAYNKEVSIHKQAGELAPKIFAESIQRLHTRKPQDQSDEGVLYDGSATDDIPPYDGGLVSIIIMEYLDPKEWLPLQSLRHFESAYLSVLNLTYDLVFTKKLKNIVDYPGNTGQHIYRNKLTWAMKVLDFGGFQQVTDPANDFMAMSNEIQGTKYITWPSQEDTDCYGMIMDLSSPVPDECQNYYLYRCREWLFKKLGIDPIRNTRLRDKLTRKKQRVGSIAQTKRKKKTPKKKKRSKKKKKKKRSNKPK